MRRYQNVRCYQLLLALSIAGAAFAQPQLFTPDHTAKVRMVSSAVISADGKYTAYILRVPRKPFEDASGGSWAELHVVFPNGQSRIFIAGEVSISGLAWTPDQRGISFTTKRGSDKNTSLYVIPIDGGEARQVLSFESSIASYSWSPDGRRVAFIATDRTDPEKKKLSDKGFNQEIYEEEFRPVRVHVVEIGVKGAKPRALELPGVPGELHWSPVGNQLAMALAPTPLVDDHYMKRKVHVVDIDSGKIVAKFNNSGKLGKISWSPDGKHVAFLSAEDLNDPNAGRLMVGSVLDGKHRQIALHVDGDYQDIVWKDAGTIAYLAAVGVTTRYGHVNLSGEHDVKIKEGRHVLRALTLSRDGSTAAMTSESSAHPWEVFILSSGNAAPIRLTDSNPWLADMRFARQEVVTYKARDGLELQGILIHPLDEKKGERHPLILCVHGGPESHDNNGWLTYYSKPGQTAAARGFAVFYPNYRGSTGRGVKFSKLGQADYAGKEFDDLVDAVDHFVETGLVDAKRVGITGGSYGGYASAWGATYYSHRYAASVMFVGISNTISKSGTTDIPNEMYQVHARKKLYGNWQWYLERSPIFHVEKARTPLLILHGKEDTRVHPSQSMELYRHIKTLGKAPVRLVFYPGEGHGNRNSAARLDYNLRMLRWFQHYLQGDGGAPPSIDLKYEFGTKKDADDKNDAEKMKSAGK